MAVCSPAPPSRQGVLSLNIGTIPLKSALRAPTSEALVDIPNQRRIDFASLENRVCRLANGLIDSCHAVKGDRVAVLSKNCIEYMEIFFACARVGLIIQPLNWRLGDDELNRIIEDGNPTVIIHAGEYVDLKQQLEKIERNNGIIELLNPGSIY